MSNQNTFVIGKGTAKLLVSLRPLTAEEDAAVNTDNSYVTDQLEVETVDGFKLQLMALDPGTGDITVYPHSIDLLPLSALIYITVKLSTDMRILTVTETINQGIVSGNYKLQAKGANLGTDFIDIATVTGQPTSGSFDLPTLPVGPSEQFINGNSYTFRVLDTTTGAVSQEVIFMIPADAVFSLTLAPGNFRVNNENLPVANIAGTVFTNGNGLYDVRMICAAVGYDNTTTVAGPANGIWGTNGRIVVPSDVYGQTIEIIVSQNGLPGTFTASIFINIPVCTLITFVTTDPAQSCDLQIDGTGNISWGDGANDTYTNPVGPTSHVFANPGTYNILLHDIDGMTTFTVNGTTTAYVTGVDAVPDTITNLDLSHNQIADQTPVDNNPALIAVIDLSYNVMDSAFIDQVINSLNFAGLSAPLVMNINNQTPPAPPTPASMAGLLGLRGRGVTVNTD
jgi:hypothetical protein